MNKLMINRIFGILMILGIFAFFSVTLLAADDFSERMVPEPPGIKVERWVENLEIPWSLVFLPNNRALVSERPGRIRLIENGILREEPYAILEVTHIGEGGVNGSGPPSQLSRRTLSLCDAYHPGNKGLS
jgi:glucose/arabinose dehydrogenase